MQKKFFGTDGVRGRVGEYPVMPDFFLKLGYVAGRVLSEQGMSSKTVRPTVLVSKDTRASGYMLESALEAGFSAAGVDVLLAGPLPTPAVAYLTHALRLNAGIVISASHNPYYDNGVKFFSSDGFKLSDDLERAIELGMAMPLVVSDHLGKVRRLDDARGRYIEFCKRAFPKYLNLRGLRLVVDSANGACYGIAPHIFHELGAEVISLHDQPDGMNINDKCGALHPEVLHATVLQSSADLGIAVDGDGDRLLLIDANGKQYDGDDIIWLIAQAMHSKQRLRGVVATVMSNLALEKSVATLGVPFIRARVGDRYVIEQMRQRGINLGGESSGHIVCADYHTTGDGLIAALQVLALMLEKQCDLSDIPNALCRYPQVNLNIPVEHMERYKAGLPSSLITCIEEAEALLQSSGRIVVRPSGTEPVVRVMVEGESLPFIQAIASRLADAVRVAC